jgi:hypothetical protein
MTQIKKILAVASVATMLIGPATAFAAKSSDEVYGGAGEVISGLQQGSGGGGPNSGGGASPSTVKAQSQGGNLPFTGADLGVLAAAGGVLVGLGFGLRRLTHRPTQA